MLTFYSRYICRIVQRMFLYDQLFENLSIFTTTNDNALECRKLPNISMMGADLPQLETTFTCN